MLDNVRIDDNTISFELRLGSSAWIFLVGRDVIEFLAQHDLDNAENELDVDSVYEQHEGLLSRIAINMIRERAPTSGQLEITMDDLP